jgi:hypothetical protein
LEISFSLFVVLLAEAQSKCQAAIEGRQAGGERKEMKEKVYANRKLFLSLLQRRGKHGRE